MSTPARAPAKKLSVVDIEFNDGSKFSAVRERLDVRPGWVAVTHLTCRGIETDWFPAHRIAFMIEHTEDSKE